LYQEKAPCEPLKGTGIRRGKTHVRELQTSGQQGCTLRTSRLRTTAPSPADGMPGLAKPDAVQHLLYLNLIRSSIGISVGIGVKGFFLRLYIKCIAIKNIGLLNSLKP
jgi:hypothetical protein